MRIKAIALVVIILLSCCFLCGFATDATESEKAEAMARLDPSGVIESCFLLNTAGDFENASDVIAFELKTDYVVHDVYYYGREASFEYAYDDDSNKFLGVSYSFNTKNFKDMKKMFEAITEDMVEVFGNDYASESIDIMGTFIENPYDNPLERRKEGIDWEEIEWLYDLELEDLPAEGDSGRIAQFQYTNTWQGKPVNIIVAMQITKYAADTNYPELYRNEIKVFFYDPEADLKLNNR